MFGASRASRRRWAVFLPFLTGWAIGLHYTLHHDRS